VQREEHIGVHAKQYDPRQPSKLMFQLRTCGRSVYHSTVARGNTGGIHCTASVTVCGATCATVESRLGPRRGVGCSVGSCR
jgi:hypothetical protein